MLWQSQDVRSPQSPAGFARCTSTGRLAGTLHGSYADGRVMLRITACAPYDR